MIFSEFAYSESAENIRPVEKKKRIIIDDDAEEDFPFMPSNTSSSTPVLDLSDSPVIKRRMDNNEWLDKRNPSEITDQEKKSNILLARKERKQGGDINFYKTFGAQKSNPIDLLSSPDLENTPDHSSRPVFQKDKTRLEKLKSRAIRAEKRSRTNGNNNLKSKSKSKSKKSMDDYEDDDDDDYEEEEPEEDDEDEGSVDSDDVTEESDEQSVGDSDDSDENVKMDEDGDKDHEFNVDEEDRGKSELKLMATKILKKCDMTITNLRSALKEWAGKSVFNDEAANGNNEQQDGCVNLLAIDEAVDASEILKDTDIQRLCPDLMLKPYQLVGVNWLKLLHQNSVNGVLADDMGLGKTVQTIAFLGWLKSSTNSKYPHLIVVPASTLSNWMNEIDKFCPELRYLTYHGTQKERDLMRRELSLSIKNRQIDVVLSTYTIFERESCKDDQSFLRREKFEYLILDEAHCIKNSASSRFQKLNSLNSKHRLLLSGTPVQNDIKELLALLSFLMPKIFSRSDCEILVEAFGLETVSGSKDKYANLISKENQSSRKGKMTLSHLRSMLAPFVLRRLKMNVLDQLVAKETYVSKLEMSEMQKRVYDNILRAHAQRKNSQKIDENYANLEVLQKKKSISDIKSLDLTNADEEVTFLPAPSVINLTENENGKIEEDDEFAKIIRDISPSEAKNIFTALRKAANHPLLLRVRYVEEEKISLIANTALAMGHFGKHCDKIDRIRAEIDSFSDFDIHQLCLQYPNYLGHLQLDSSTLYDSPKMSYLRNLIPKLRSEGRRMLIFSQWTRILDLLEVLLDDMDYKYLRLDGSTPIKDRQDMIDEFSLPASDGELHPIPVFLLSTKAGGLGINLTAADTVILHDLDFNPENDRQAEDRCHRIGQKKNVMIYKLVTTESVDEDIFEMGERKSRLTQAVLSEDHPTDESGNKKKSDNSEESMGDIGSIGRILQKALQRFIK